MANSKNKVKFGLSQVKIFPITKDDESGTEYGEGFKVPGAVSLSLGAEGSSDPFYADNVPYFVTVSNNGYSGDLEMALIPDEFFTAIIGQTKGKDGVLIENAMDKGTSFAMAFQFEGDVNATRHILYKCTATRPDTEGETIAEKVEPKAEKFSFTAIPRISDQNVKAKCDGESTAYATFFDKPYEPKVEAGTSQG